MATRARPINVPFFAMAHAEAYEHNERPAASAPWGVRFLLHILAISSAQDDYKKNEKHESDCSGSQTATTVNAADAFTSNRISQVYHHRACNFDE
ncbi:hypothetical protein [Cohnella soli]|uniref:Uncharacterized protein n=1 Tax=Cohnella soli TaxID=425005 RepID=A0ABW0HSP0_9BACL